MSANSFDYFIEKVVPLIVDKISVKEEDLDIYIKKDSASFTNDTRASNVLNGVYKEVLDNLRKKVKKKVELLVVKRKIINDNLTVLRDGFSDKDDFNIIEENFSKSLKNVEEELNHALDEYNSIKFLETHIRKYIAN